MYKQQDFNIFGSDEYIFENFFYEHETAFNFTAPSFGENVFGSNDLFQDIDGTEINNAWPDTFPILNTPLLNAAKGALAADGPLFTPPVASFELSDLLAVNGGDGTEGFVINGYVTGSWSGFSVSSAGDFNNDGFDDLLIGAPQTGANQTDAGTSYIVFGSASGFNASFELSSLLAINGGTGSAGMVIEGLDAGDLSGWSVSNAGDVNGDLIDDIIIGAMHADSDINSIRDGESYIIFGIDSATTSIPASFDLSSLDGTNGFIVSGTDFQGQSGAAVSAAGDINGDGIGDIIIGADYAGFEGDLAGKSYVFFGQDTSVTPFAAAMDVSSLNGTNGFALLAFDPYEFSGFSVSSAGDINADGFDDILIGAYGSGPNFSEPGSTYLVFGRDTSVTPFPASFDLRTLNGTDGFVLTGINAEDQSRRFSLGRRGYKLRRI